MSKYAAESERLLLQPLNMDEHLEAYHHIASNPVGMAWSSKQVSPSFENTREMLASRLPNPEIPWMENYMILVKSLGSSQSDGKAKVIGSIGTPRNEPAGAEIGYKLHPDYWGKGYGSEAVKLFIEYYWSPYRDGVKRDSIIAQVDPENLASERLVEKIGFRKGELRRDAYQRGRDIGTDVKSDLRVWHFDKPEK